jgi:ribose 5-phosphate isomerase
VHDLDALGRLDLTVDGADEVDGALRLIKGGGAALLREKIVAHASDRMVVIADESKRVATLGAFPLPVEVVRFGWRTDQGGGSRGCSPMPTSTAARSPCGSRAKRRLVTDEGHMILDLSLGRIGDAPDRLAAALLAVPGVVEHGLFLGMAERAILGRADGTCTSVGPGGEPGLTPEEARAWAEELTRSIEARGMFDYDLFVIGGGSGGCAPPASPRPAARGSRSPRNTDGRHLRDPRLRAEEADGLRQRLRRRLRGRGRLRLERRRDELRLGRADRRQGREIARLEAAYRGNLAKAGAEIHNCRATVVDPHRVRLAAAPR